MIWQPDTLIDLPLTDEAGIQRHYIKLMRALLPRSRGKSHRALVDILCEHAPTDDLERIQFLKLVSRRLHGRVLPQAARTQNTSLSTAMVRAGIQRWALELLSDGVLEAVCERVVSRRNKSVRHDYV